jgi:pyruvate dehydrogenase E2 component (dihydrolipoamide acetyltransferase)
MPRPFVLPDLGEGLTEAEILNVLVHEGDVIAEDTPLLEVETDKATVEIPSPMSGRVEKIHVQSHQTVKVGAVLVTFSDAEARPGKQAADTLDPTRTLAPESKTVITDGRARQAPPPSAGARSDDRAPTPRVQGPVPAAPSTRRLARELGVSLHAVRASGPGGRVTDQDVRAAAASPAPSPDTGTATTQPTARAAGAARPLTAGGMQTPPLPAFEQWGPVERQTLSHLRRTIAERMTLAATVIPHVTHFDRADITEMDALIRRNLDDAKARGITLTLTAFILKAAALSLHEHPQFNASLDAAAGELIVKRYIHLGVAVATERGLIVPVLRDVDTKSVTDVARELGTLAQRVRDGKATLDDLRGGTFTVTNIGALGGTGAIPIINYPEVAILGVARARQEAVVHDGHIAARLVLPLALTFDHRVADGADGARFASTLVRRLERPDQLLLEL